MHTSPGFTLARCIENCEGSVREEKNPSLTNFAIAHRSQDDMGAVMKGIIEAVN